MLNGLGASTKIAYPLECRSTRKYMEGSSRKAGFPGTETARNNPATDHALGQSWVAQFHEIHVGA